MSNVTDCDPGQSNQQQHEYNFFFLYRLYTIIYICHLVSSHLLPTSFADNCQTTTNFLNAAVSTIKDCEEKF